MKHQQKLLHGRLPMEVIRRRRRAAGVSTSSSTTTSASSSPSSSNAAAVSPPATRSAPVPLQWHQTQILGEQRGADNAVFDGDEVSALEFDAAGEHLAVGDHAGRVILFCLAGEQAALRRRAALEKADSPALPPPRFAYMTELQSHEQEFDALNSLEIGEKINRVRWCARPNSSLAFLSANDRTVKLWKISEHAGAAIGDDEQQQQHRRLPSESALLAEDSFFPSKKARSSLSFDDDAAPFADRYSARCRRVFAGAHEYNINSVSTSSDGETFLSGDDFRINLWSFETASQCFNIVDMKPPDMEQLVEVITCVEFHPTSCSLFAYGSSGGRVRIADMRRSALCDVPAMMMSDSEARHHPRSFFEEIAACISDVKFAGDEQHIVTRDYIDLKLWDVRMNGAPVARCPVNEHHRHKLAELYNSDAIFDRFAVAVSADGRRCATGSYSNTVKVFSMDGGIAACSTMHIGRASLASPSPTKSAGILSSLARSAHFQETVSSPCIEDEAKSKILLLSWYPSTMRNFIACASRSSLYMYSA